LPGGNGAWLEGTLGRAKGHWTWCTAGGEDGGVKREPRESGFTTSPIQQLPAAVIAQHR